MAKALVWDIETAPMVATTWSLYPKFLSHENILRDWYIICGAWKWLGEKKIHDVRIDPDAARHYAEDGVLPPDRQCVEELREAVMAADYLIAHNGDSFDLKKLNARIIYHGMDPLPPVRSVDTLKEARKIAKFSSNRLDYISKHLGARGKLPTSYGLWLRIMEGDEKALKYMVKYNRKDVVELEAVYLKLLPYMKAHPNVGLPFGKKRTCPRCGSHKVQRRGEQVTLTRVYKRYQCTKCGGWSRDSIKGGELR